MSSLLSKRERIMRHLVERFEGLVEGEDEYTATWNTVTRAPVARSQMAQGNALGLYGVSEHKDPDVGFMRCTLNVSIEFYLVLGLGDDPSTELNRALADLQRAMRSDPQMGGLAFNALETRNEFDVDGPDDSIVAGFVEFAVTYRHKVDDPRN